MGMSEELKNTQIVYGENVLMMRVDDCLIFGNKNALRSLAEKLTEFSSTESERKKGRWIDVTERKGKWQITSIKGETWGVCSNCGFKQKAGELNFCPNCGADMREDIPIEYFENGGI